MKTASDSGDRIEKAELSVALMVLFVMIVSLLDISAAQVVHVLFPPCRLDRLRFTCATPTPIALDISQLLPPESLTPVDAANAEEVSPTIFFEVDRRQVAYNEPSFGAITFCLEETLDKQGQFCETGQAVLTGCVKTVYASWSYSDAYPGMRFSRKWYQDAQRTPIAGLPGVDIWDGVRWGGNGPSEFTWLTASALHAECLPAGPYRFELCIGEDTVQVGQFQID